MNPFHFTKRYLNMHNVNICKKFYMFLCIFIYDINGVTNKICTKCTLWLTSSGHTISLKFNKSSGSGNST